MAKEHHYKLSVEWTGNRGEGTVSYKGYDRSHTIRIENKPDILASSDTAFNGDATKHNPEDLLLASISTCHMLWYLHLCSDAGVIVTDYTDNATAIMEESPTGGGRFKEVTLNPVVIVAAAAMIEKANALHAKANEKCFIANSVNFPVHHRPVAIVKNMEQ